VKQKASSLLYALFILIAVGTLLTLIIFLFLISSKTVIEQNKEDRKFYDLESGFNVLLSGNNIIPLNSSQDYDLFEDEKSIVHLSRWQWGLMESVTCSIEHENDKFEKSALIASGSSDGQRFFMVNQNSSLSLSGQAELHGKCYLPEKGLERAFISGKPYIGDKLIYGQKLLSESSMPKLLGGFKENIYSLLSQKNDSPNDSVVPFNGMTESLTHSFKKKSLVQYSEEGIYLNNLELSGNIKIISNKEVLIGSNTILNNVIIVAPYIEIEKDFEGACQIFASDSILINENVRLAYPSAVILGQEKETEVSAYLRTGDNFWIEGAVLAFQKKYDYKHPVHLSIAKESKINGTLYCDGISQLSGEINGEIITNKLFVQSPASTYVNHLQDCIINKEMISDYFVFFNIFESQTKRVVTWTE
jgi:hypothetical protein